MRKTLLFSIIFCDILLISCISNNNNTVFQYDKQILADSAMVVTAHPLASDVGIEILKSGGNAVDAAIAVQFALAVVYPRAGNIGGGGFLVLRKKDGHAATLDFREKAPKASFRDMYLDSLGNVIEEKSRFGHLSVGIPGVVDGMIEAHERYGKLNNFADLVAPAINLAQNGFSLTFQEAAILNKFHADFEKYNTKENIFIKNKQWKKGDKLIQTDLAKTLKQIQAKGRDGFYKGTVAKQLLAEMNRGNGIFKQDDLDTYRSKWREPLIEAYKNYKIISMPPPSSGGIALVQMLKTVEDYPIKDWGHHSTQTTHLMVEAERRAYADRATHLGDSDFWEVPRTSLLDKSYIKTRMSSFDPSKATSSDSIQAGIITNKESEETTHFSIVDEEGNAVAVTTTLNSNFGSKVLVGEAGFFLNNEMDDFSAKPGVPNQFDLVGAEANAIEPEKRMLSSMTPTIFTKDDKLFMVVGSPGGSTIITSVFQVFLNVAEHDMSMKDAIHNLRFHHQWLPNKVFIEEGALSETVITDLEAMGHIVEIRKPIGRVEGILIQENGIIEGAADNRGDDDAEGY